MSFQQKELTFDLTRTNASGRPLLRRFSSCILKDVTLSVYIKAFVTSDIGEDDVWNLVINPPKFRCRGIEPQETRSSPLVRDIIGPLAHNSPYFAKPMTDILAGNASLPFEIVFHVKEGMLYDGRVMRAILNPKRPEISQFTKKDGGIRRQWVIHDRYKELDGSESTYCHSLSAWPDTCADFLIDPQFWFDIVSANPAVECYIFARCEQAETMALEANQPETLQSRDLAGTYQFKVMAIYPDYLTWFEAGNGIELSAEQALEPFIFANKRDRRFFSKTKGDIREDGEYEEIIQFTSVLTENAHIPVSNPSETPTIFSRVICLGSAKRPVFSCSDAHSLFVPEAGHRYFAMVSDLSTTNESFVERAISEQISYQIFIIQNFEGPTKKQHV
jgi:hypothetical protein